MKSKKAKISLHKKLNEFADMNGIAIDDILKKMHDTASISNTTIYQLCKAILKVDVTALYMPGGAMRCIEVLGILANYGINDEEAGLHLRYILLSLLHPSEDAKNRMNQLGISEVDANGELKDFSELFPELRKVITNRSENQKLDLLSTLFSKKSIVPAIRLCYGIAPEKGVKA